MLSDVPVRTGYLEAQVGASSLTGAYARLEGGARLWQGLGFAAVAELKHPLILISPSEPACSAAHGLSEGKPQMRGLLRSPRPTTRANGWRGRAGDAQLTRHGSSSIE
ncbi:hypothetical protein D7Y15_23310 [Corallococcus sp. AB030]|nr:hypothetical protein D7Y15_23310 [Corallococcus sp. AB030]